MSKVVNFGAGPAKLPEKVLQKVQKELLDYEGGKISIMEMSHRSPVYLKLNHDIQDLVRKLLKVPANFKIIFMQGGGTGQFAAVPMNLIGRTGVADYLVTGAWSKKAAKEAQKYGTINMVLPPQDKFVTIPDQSTWTLNPDASYVHICCNETVHGVEFHNIPNTKNVPLVADMSSNFMSREINFSKFGVIYAGAQKNIGPAGVTLVIVREDLLGFALPYTPSVLDWADHVKSDSILNTPPVFPIYVMGEVFRWIVSSGGVEQMEKAAMVKSSILYDVIDRSNGFFVCPVDKNVRSRMNVPFRIYKEDGPEREKLENEFLLGAKSRGLIQLKGHRDVGGIRASIYNAVTVEEVEILCNYMRDFHAKRVISMNI